jgi:hypothetical protein
MDALPQRRWLGVSTLVGITYALIGVSFALPSSHFQVWRLAAWTLSLALFANHIRHERFRLHNSCLRTALHGGFAAALGAFGLALGANVHSLSTTAPPQHQRLLIIALVAWPAIIGVAAFFVAFAVSALFSRR